MSSKTIGIVALIAGIVIALVFALADLLGIGSHPDVFGQRQIIGIVIGGVVFIVGIVLFLRQPPS